MAHPDYRSRVAAEVRAEMARQQMSTRSLAAALGVPSSNLNRRIGGLSSFSVEELASIAAVLGVSPEQFMPAASAAGSVA